jgi:hypothetical protein
MGVLMKVVILFALLTAIILPISASGDMSSGECVQAAIAVVKADHDYSQVELLTLKRPIFHSLPGHLIYFMSPDIKQFAQDLLGYLQL